MAETMRTSTPSRARLAAGLLAVLAGLLFIGLGLVPKSEVRAEEGMVLVTQSEDEPNGGVCLPLDSGKIDTTGDPSSVTVYAPEGKLISGYCVKAGSIHQGLGPVYVPVDPPAEMVVITYPEKDSISHYSLSYVDISTTTTTTTTTLPEETTTTAATTTTLPEETTTTAATTTLPGGTTTTAAATTLPAATTTVTSTTAVLAQAGPTTTAVLAQAGPTTTMPGALPATGPSSDGTMLAIGAAFLVAGAALLRLSRPVDVTEH